MSVSNSLAISHAANSIPPLSQPESLRSSCLQELALEDAALRLPLFICTRHPKEDVQDNENSLADTMGNLMWELFETRVVNGKTIVNTKTVITPLSVTRVLNCNEVAQKALGHLGFTKENFISALFSPTDPALQYLLEAVTRPTHSTTSPATNNATTTLPSPSATTTSTHANISTDSNSSVGSSSSSDLSDFPRQGRSRANALIDTICPSIPALDLNRIPRGKQNGFPTPAAKTISTNSLISTRASHPLVGLSTALVIRTTPTKSVNTRTQTSTANSDT